MRTDFGGVDRALGRPDGDTLENAGRGSLPRAGKPQGDRRAIGNWGGVMNPSVPSESACRSACQGQNHRTGLAPGSVLSPALIHRVELVPVM